MSISKAVKHAIRNAPGVQKAVFRTRKTAQGKSEFVKVTLKPTSVSWAARDTIKAIARKAYDWKAIMTSGSLKEFTMRLNSDYH